MEEDGRRGMTRPACAPLARYRSDSAPVLKLELIRDQVWRTG